MTALTRSIRHEKDRSATTEEEEEEDAIDWRCLFVCVLGEIDWQNRRDTSIISPPC